MTTALMEWTRQQESYWGAGGHGPVHIADRHAPLAYCGAAPGGRCEVVGALMCERCCIAALRKAADLMEAGLRQSSAAAS